MAAEGERIAQMSDLSSTDELNPETLWRSLTLYSPPSESWFTRQFSGNPLSHGPIGQGAEGHNTHREVLSERSLSSGGALWWRTVAKRQKEGPGGK